MQYHLPRKRSDACAMQAEGIRQAGQNEKGAALNLQPLFRFATDFLTRFDSR